MNESLRDSNLLLQGKCETLLEDLSVKEAQWSQKEDRLTAEVSSLPSTLGGGGLPYCLGQLLPP